MIIHKTLNQLKTIHLSKIHISNAKTAGNR